MKLHTPFSSVFNLYGYLNLIKESKKNLKISIKCVFSQKLLLNVMVGNDWNESNITTNINLISAFFLKKTL